MLAVVFGAFFRYFDFFFSFFSIIIFDLSVMFNFEICLFLLFNVDISCIVVVFVPIHVEHIHNLVERV